MQRILCSALVVLGVLACSRDKQREPVLTPASGSRSGARPQLEPSRDPERPAPRRSELGPDGVVPGVGSNALYPSPSALSQARCQRERRCDRVGVERPYGSMDECEALLYPEGEDMLSSCPTGVSGEAFARCVEFVESSACEDESFGERAPCRSSDVCMP
jgi:hypothetical protein